ncbi:MAG: hypothetical protein LBL41_05025 [Bifidobacteriaceae bacterium]|jgi:hypothetical protein|nr:hypothetical protein [Bifidobacteriaceae bacterium]
MKQILTIDMDNVNLDELKSDEVRSPLIVEPSKYSRARVRQLHDPKTLFKQAIYALQNKRDAFSIYHFLNPVLAVSVTKRAQRNMFPETAALVAVEEHKIYDDKVQVIGTLKDENKQVTIFSLFNKINGAWIMEDLRIS